MNRAKWLRLLGLVVGGLIAAAALAAPQILPQLFFVFILLMMGLVPLAMAVLAGLSLRRSNVLGRSLLLLAGLAVTVALLTGLLIALWPVNPEIKWVNNFGTKALYLLSLLFGEISTWLVPAAGLGLIGLLISANVRNDTWLVRQNFMLLVLAGNLFLFYLTVLLSTNRSPLSDPGLPISDPGLSVLGNMVVVALNVGTVLLPAAFCLNFCGFVMQRLFWPAMAALPVALLTLFYALAFLLFPIFGKNYPIAMDLPGVQVGLANVELGGIALPQAAGASMLPFAPAQDSRLGSASGPLCDFPSYFVEYHLPTGDENAGRDCGEV